MKGRYMTMKTKTENKGFTLIELLVVIAIISVLLSVITPALRSARRQAQRTVCYTNIRGQYVAQLFYATENKGRFAPHWDACPDYVRTNGNDSGKSMVHEAMDDYIENSNMLLCPVLFTLGGPWYNDIGYITPDRQYGGWDSYDPQSDLPRYMGINYFWFANYRTTNGVKPQFSFTARDSSEVREPEWPDRLSDCNESKAFITHVCYYHWGHDLTWDHSHGAREEPILGNVLWDEVLEESELSGDNPVGYADGHVEYRLKLNMKPRVLVDPGDSYPFEIYY